MIASARVKPSNYVIGLAGRCTRTSMLRMAAGELGH